MSVSALSSSSSSYWEKMLAQMKGSSESQTQDNLAGKLFGDLDSDGDGTLTLSETGLSKDLYSKIDADGDGTVTQTELQKAIETQRNAMFTSMQLGQSQTGSATDTSTTGQPTAKDLLSSIMSGQVPGGMHGAGKGKNGDDLASKLFSTLDSDSSNGLSVDETGLSQSVFDSMDVNQDGSVSADELATALEKQRAAMGSGQGSSTRTQIAQSFLSAIANSAYQTLSQTTATTQGVEAVA